MLTHANHRTDHANLNLTANQATNLTANLPPQATNRIARRTLRHLGVAALLSLVVLPIPADARTADLKEPPKVYRRSAEVQGINIFYREAGIEHKGNGAPTLVLLHGFPTSSHMFRNFIPLLADDYHIIAPDFPGYGLSDAPPVDEFEYTFDNVASIVEQILEDQGVERWVLYLQDYGAPVGFRLAVNHPDRVAGLIVQNGNAYEEGLPDDFWGPWRVYWKDRQNQEAINYLANLLTLESTIWQFTHGTREPDAIDPDNWLAVQPKLDRPGNALVQLAYAFDYGSNPPRYPKWQQYLRDNQPPTIITWGRNDKIFPTSGALPYLRDLPNAELHLLDTGHFALDEDGDLIAALVKRWWQREVTDKDAQQQRDPQRADRTEATDPDDDRGLKS